MGAPGKYLLVSTIAGLFSSAAVLRLSSMDVQLWYGLMAVNLLLFVWLGAVRLRPGMWQLATVLLASGAIGCLQGTGSNALFAKQFLGITATAFYFSCYYYLAGDDAVLCFRHYVRAAYYVSIGGIVLALLQLPFAGELPRLQSILAEPAMFALVTLPAAYYCLDRYVRQRTHGKELAVITVALLLSRSSVGFLGILFGIALYFARPWTRAVCGIVCVGAVGAALYFSSADFRTRVDDTLRSAREVTVVDANLSTFALVSNAFVVARVLAEHPIAGNGLGSHQRSHDRYIAELPGIAMFESMILRGQTTMDELNAPDANSLLLRLLSDTGIAGVLLVLAFLVRFQAPPEGEARAVHLAVLVYFFAKLLRAGHYFSPEEFFFVFAYCLTARGAREVVACA